MPMVARPPAVGGRPVPDRRVSPSLLRAFALGCIALVSPCLAYQFGINFKPVHAEGCKEVPDVPT